jgi:hypothetical protein
MVSLSIRVVAFLSRRRKVGGAVGEADGGFNDSSVTEYEWQRRRSGGDGAWAQDRPLGSMPSTSTDSMAARAQEKEEDAYDQERRRKTKRKRRAKGCDARELTWTLSMGRELM